MLFLLSAITCSVIISILFKFFDRYGVNTFQAIVVNYFFCVATGIVVGGENPFTNHFWEEPWFPFAIILGGLFISGFYAIGLSIQSFGLAVTSVLQRMSLLMSVPFAIFWYEEPLNIFKILGLIAAIAAVILINWVQEEDSNRTKRSTWVWLILAYTFISSGIIECLLQYVEVSIFRPIGKSGDASFMIFLFGTAGCIGFTILMTLIASKRTTFAPKSLPAGAILGIINFFSIYFMMRAFGQMDGSLALPLNNVGVMTILSVIAILFFKENLVWEKKLGIAAAILSIVLMACA